MQIKKLVLYFFIAGLLSYISLILCVRIIDEHECLRLLVSSFFSGLIGFGVVRYVVPDPFGKIGESSVGASLFEKYTIMATLWLPIVLALFAVFALLQMNFRVGDVAWILVYLAMSIGANLEAIHRFYFLE